MRDGMGEKDMEEERERGGGELATNDPRRVIGVPVARVGIDFIPRRRILRQRELESRGKT